MAIVQHQDEPACTEHEARPWRVTPVRTLVLAALIYVIAASWLSLRRHYGFVEIADTHIFENILWNTCHGKILHWGMVGINSLGNHMSPSMLLVAPAYAVCQSPVTLILVQRVLLAASAVVFYYCANRILASTRAACMLAVAYLAYPPLHGLNMDAFVPVILSVPLLMWMFYCYEARQRRWMWVAVVLSLGVKENVPLVVAAFGLYVALLRREVKLGVTVTTVATVWFVLALRVIIPYFAGNSFDTVYVQRYCGPEVGTTFAEVASFPVRHPIRALTTVLGRDQRSYLLHLLGPTGFLALAAPDVLLCSAPLLLQNLLATSWHGMRSTLCHYHAAILPGLLYATAHGIRRVAHLVAPRLQCQPRRVSEHLAGALLVCCAIYLPFSKELRLQIHQSWEYPFEAPAMAPPRRAVAKRLMAMVPPRAVVACPLNLANHMAGRPTFYSNVRNLPLPREGTAEGNIPPPDWVLLDLKLGAVEGIHQVMRDLRHLERFLAQDYECVERGALFVLLRRCETDEPTPGFRFTQEEAQAYWLATYQRALGSYQASPRRVDLLHDVACVLNEGNQPHLAIELLEGGLPVVGPAARLYVLLGLCYRELGKTEKAVQAWQQALRVAPDHRAARDLLAETQSGHNTPAP